MVVRRLLWQLVVLGMALWSCQLAWAAPYQLVYPRPENDDYTRTSMQFAILQEALNKTVAQYGPYTLVYSAAKMNHPRSYADMKSPQNSVNVMARTYQTELTETLLALPFPVDRGIVGHRVLLIRAGTAPQFAQIKTLDQLRKVRFGTVATWSDVKIFEDNRLLTERGGSLDNVIKMLAAKRFDAVSLDVEEIQKIVLDNSGLEVEPHLLLHYPSARIFYFSRDKDGAANLERIRAGLDIMVRDGSFSRLFLHYRGAALHRSKIEGRTMLQLENRLVPADSVLRTSPLMLTHDGVRFK